MSIRMVSVPDVEEQWMRLPDGHGIRKRKNERFSGEYGEDNVADTPPGVLTTPGVLTYG